MIQVLVQRRVHNGEVKGGKRGQEGASFCQLDGLLPTFDSGPVTGIMVSSVLPPQE